MKKTILTAMLFFAFSFLMVTGLSAQNSSLIAPTQNATSKQDLAYLDDLPGFVESGTALILLRTEAKAAKAAIGTTEENEVAIGQLQAKFDLYSKVHDLIYRENLSVEHAVIQGWATSSSTPQDMGTIFANSGTFQDLVDLLKE